MDAACVTEPGRTTSAAPAWPTSRSTRAVAGVTAFAAFAGLIAELVYALVSPPPVSWVRAFSLSAEANFPTAVSGGLMLLNAWLLAGVARRDPSERPGRTAAAAWAALSVGFVAMAADELLEIHETLLLRPGSGILYFGWVVPGAALVAALGLVFVPFLVRLPVGFRRRAIMAGALFVVGALGMELPLGLVAERLGVDSPAYAAVDWIEETLELAGMAFFAITLLQLHETPLPSTDATLAAAAKVPDGGGFLVSLGFDWLFILAPPLVALFVGVLISGTAFSYRVESFLDSQLTWSELLLGSLIHAHLVAVFFRSHANAEIRRRHPVRFLAIPVLLLAGILISPWVAAGAVVLATFWDVWHSGAQTFGFGRIYDMRRGNDPAAGRRLDFALNQLLYAGPILAGVTLGDHLASFSAFDDLSIFLSMRAPAMVNGAQGTLARVVFLGGLVFLAGYVAFYVRLARSGYRVSWQKIFLLVTTGLCSITCWTWNSWGEAFFVMNLFHAVQYLAFVWAQEGKRLRQRFADRWAGSTVPLVIYLAAVGAYGFWAMLVNAHLWWSVTIVVSLMHFWYDGFVWSVRRRDVAAPS